MALTVRSDSTVGRAAVHRFASDGARVHAPGGEPDRDGSEVRGCLDRFGRIDLLVIPPPDAIVEAFPRATSEDHRAAIGTVLRTAYFVAQHAARAMTDGGRICVVASPRPEGIDAGIAAPATTVEGGLVAMVRLLAVELAPEGIAVNGVCPIATRFDPGRVAAALAFLASEDASYVSGTFLPIVR